MRNENVNIGLMGHVDSGKTSIAKCLSSVGGTACFDKSPQSQSRGITLDLGFSTYNFNQRQVTIVDCPGHASLIRTVLCGAQIIDLIVLVVDATKGIQAQTAECLIVAEIMTERLVFAVNKIDLWGDSEEEQLKKFELFKTKLRNVLKDGKFAHSPIILFSALSGLGVDVLKSEIDKLITEKPIVRNIKDNFVFAVDHCFPIKGQGTVLTGTVLQGQISVNDMIEISELGQSRKIKSMQSFRESVKMISAGDRAGICVQSLESESIERTLITGNCNNSLKRTSRFLLKATRVKYFKGELKSKGRIHISILNEAVLCKQFIIVSPKADGGFEYMEKVDDDALEFHVIVELERPVNILPGAIVIGSKLDSDPSLQKCRIAFHGRYEEGLDSKSSNGFKIYKVKERFGLVDRIVSENRLIGRGLSANLLMVAEFKGGKDAVASVSKYIGIPVTILKADSEETICNGIIDSLFGSSGKFNIQLSGPLETTDWKNLYIKLAFKKDLK